MKVETRLVLNPMLLHRPFYIIPVLAEGLLLPEPVGIIDMVNPAHMQFGERLFTPFADCGFHPGHKTDYFGYCVACYEMG